MSKTLTIKGPNLVNVLKTVKSLDIDMTSSGLNKAGKLLKAEAQSLSPTKSGAFKQSIVLLNKGRIKAGQAQTLVGVDLNSKAWKYAAKVERKHKIFRTLEKSKAPQVVKILGNGVNDFWKNQKV